MDVRVYRPQAIVVFHTETGDLVARATNDPGNRLDDDIVSIKTMRDMGADAPTFNINLTRRRAWHLWVASNDRVTIIMHRPPEQQAVVFTGLVDDCRKKVMISDEPQRVITITGRGVAKSFIQFDIGYVPEVQFVDVNVGWLTYNNITLAGQTADQILGAVWDNIAKKQVNCKWNDGTELFDVIQNNLTSRPELKLMDQTSYMNFQGSLWAFMKEIADEPFNELFWEIDGNKPTLFLRKTPFDRDDWEKLPIIDIFDEEVLLDDTGRSDLETYTLFSVGAKTVFAPQDAYNTLGMPPLWYAPYYDKYGLRRLHVESAYAAIADKTSAGYITEEEVLKIMQVSLFNWNIMNNSFFNGNLIVRGSNRFKVGCRLMYKCDEESSYTEYYIKSVSQSFVNFGSWTTEVGVIRGMNPKKRFESPYDKFEDYRGSKGLVPYNPNAVSLWEQAKGGGGAMSGGGATPATPSPDVSYDPTTSNLQGADAVVALAKDIVNWGITYQMGAKDIRRGGTGDCSGFTKYVFLKAANIDIGDGTATQMTKGVQVPYEKLLPGDLIFFKGTIKERGPNGISHVGIIINTNGDFVNLGGSGVYIANWKTNSYWGRAAFHTGWGRRVLTSVGDSGAGGNWMLFQATAYGKTGQKTAGGTWPKEGRTIAVDPKVIPLGSKVKVLCPSKPEINNKIFIAEDTGGAIKGKIIDVYLDVPENQDPERFDKFGRPRDVKLCILERGTGKVKL